MSRNTYYRPCSFCGANLDPDERCDCLRYSDKNPFYNMSDKDLDIYLKQVFEEFPQDIDTLLNDVDKK